MSLKYFHILFITIVALFLGFFGYWAMGFYAAGESLAYAVLGGFSWMSAVALMVYGRAFWAKLKDVGFFTLILVLVSERAMACAICYGDPTHPISKALTWSVVFLLVAIMTILCAIVAFALHYLKRCREMNIQ